MGRNAQGLQEPGSVTPQLQELGTGHFTSKPRGLLYGMVLDPMTAPRFPSSSFILHWDTDRWYKEVIMDMMVTKMPMLLILINEKRTNIVGACSVADIVLCVLHGVSYLALTAIP